MNGWKLPVRRRVALAVAVVGLALAAFVSTALATTVNYFGYANLTANNPPAGSCFSGSIAGLACSGWNNWDYSQAAWNSGRSSWILGFLCQSDGLVHGRLFNGSEAFNTYTILWSDWCPGHYNEAAVSHVNGGSESYNYLQARALIYP